MNSLQYQKIVFLEVDIAQYKVSSYGASTIGDKSANTKYDKMSYLLQSCFIEKRAHILYFLHTPFFITVLPTFNNIWEISFKN
jgi:hypothetical protein